MVDLGSIFYLFVLSFVSFKMESQFGSSVTCLDVNQDGVLDLVVGAPGFGNSDVDDHNVKMYSNSLKEKRLQKVRWAHKVCASLLL